ncbi:hypothetical protein TNCT_662081 [Trichonephila clavata]|uniref:BTB domain-containing protein n=1 Tax=Trichonephila clavata TaxID=2740835 RepID=A0A8X6KEB7_TRICU|nr:hypothetical protein TNCT_662081 [Trichonephila clavata]
MLMAEELSVLSKDLKKEYENRQFCDLILRSDFIDEDEKKVLTEATLDMEPAVLRVLLDYVYSGKVDSTASVIPTSLYEVAKSYEMVDLKEKLYTSS